MNTQSDRPSRLPPALRGAVIVSMGGVLAVPFAARVATAQATSPAPASSRSAPAGKNTAGNRLKYLVVGAATGGVLATAYYFISEHGRNSSSCAPWSCALPFLSVSGAFSGLFIQKDVSAQRRAEAPRVGSALQFSTSEVPLPAAPIAVAVRDSLAAVATDSGAQLISTAAARPVALRRRGIGLSDMRQVALLPSAPNLLVGTGFALWEGSVGAGQLSRAYDGPIDALATSDNGVLAASGSTVLYRRGSGTAATIDSLKVTSPVSAAVHDPVTGQFWVSTDSALMEVLVNGSTIALGRKFAMPAKALAIAVSPDWIVAVLGSEGLAAWRRDALGASVVTPVRLRDEPRFAFDAAFLGSDLYVAGGVDGLFRVSLSPVPQVVGSSRQIRYATSVHADKGVLWVGDRSRQALVRVTPP